MSPVDCPTWVYEDHPRRGEIIGLHVAETISALASRNLDSLAFVSDTRDTHGRIFQDLTPVGFAYYAGHYRGELFRCLQFCQVGIEGDARVGAPPESVAILMRDLSTTIIAGMIALDANTLLTTKERLRYIIALTSRAFVAFLTIHPYLNGNGHIARLIVWGMTGRYGFWPRRWTVEPRPPDPPYSTLIVSHRNGDYEPLEKFLLQALLS